MKYKPEPYQFHGSAFLLSNPRGGIDAAEPGMGKCAVAVLAASLESKRIFVQCPAVSRINWKREFDLWWPDRDAELMIESYDKVTTNPTTRRQVIDFKPDTIINDECQALMNYASARTRSTYGTSIDGSGLDKGMGLIRLAEHRWGLSGTLAPTPFAYWTHLRALRPELITFAPNANPLTFEQFIDRYFDWYQADYGPRFKKNKPNMLPELRTILDQIRLRRTWKSLGIKMPQTVTEHVLVDGGSALDQLQKLAAEDKRAAQIMLADVERQGDIDPCFDGDIHLATLRRLIGEIKAPIVGQMIRDELNENLYNKIVIFAWHHSVIEILKDELTEFNPITLTGATSETKRQEGIDKFQNEPQFRVAILQLKAFSTAITLTAATEVVNVEPSWDEDTNVQAVLRVMRKGQTKPVRNRIVGLANSSDDAVTRVCAGKARAALELEVT